MTSNNLLIVVYRTSPILVMRGILIRLRGFLQKGGQGSQRPYTSAAEASPKVGPAAKLALGVGSVWAYKQDRQQRAVSQLRRSVSSSVLAIARALTIVTLPGVHRGLLYAGGHGVGALLERKVCRGNATGRCGIILPHAYPFHLEGATSCPEVAWRGCDVKVDALPTSRRRRHKPLSRLPPPGPRGAGLGSEDDAIGGAA